MKLNSSEPYWLVKNGIINSYPSVQQDIKTEILIVGSGITGSLIAHQCISEGYDVVIVDRRDIGNGSTSATTSMLQYEIDVPLHKLINLIGREGAESSYWACYDAIDTLHKISKSIKSKAGLKYKKSLYFAAYKKDISALKAEFDARKDAKFPVQWLESDDIKNKFGIENTYGGILSSQGASMDAFCMAHELLAYNAKKGLKVYDKTDLINVNYAKNKIKAVTETGKTIKAKHIIYCNGFESTEIIKEKFVNLLSTYALISEVQSETNRILDDLLVWNTAEPYMYMRTTDDNRFLIGGEDEVFYDASKRDNLLQNKSTKLEKLFKKYVPNDSFISDFAWAGTFGETKDGLPYIGKHKDFPGAYFVLGFGGNGITFSVIGMKMLSDYLSGKEHKLCQYFKFER